MEGCDVTAGSARDGGQKRAGLATRDQSGEECWKIVHNTEEQSGSEQWVSEVYILEVTGVVS